MTYYDGMIMYDIYIHRTLSGIWDGSFVSDVVAMDFETVRDLSWSSPCPYVLPVLSNAKHWLWQQPKRSQPKQPHLAGRSGI